MAKENSFEEVKRLFQYISIESFIRYFELFEEYHNSRDNTFIFEGFDKNKEYESWTHKSYNSRAVKGKKIFREGLEMTALEYIVHSASKNRLGPEIVEKANLLLQSRTTIEPSVLAQINKIESDNSLYTQDEKTALVKVRLGQSNYRKRLVEYWGASSVLNVEMTDLLIASHIKPFNECSEEEKYDLFNGLLLTPNYDKLFDKFLISFDQKGQILVSPLVKDLDLKKLGISKKNRLNLEKTTQKHFQYLEYHNSLFFEKEQKV